MTDNVRCRSVASKLVILYTQQDAAAAAASGAQLAIPVAIDPADARAGHCTKQLVRPSYHAYRGGRRR